MKLSLLRLIKKLILEEQEKQKISFGDYDTWIDPPVAYKQSDINVTNPTKKFALLMDKIAELLEVPEPIITSGLRDPKRQAIAMIALWKANGSEYVKDLYEKCKSCTPTAVATATKLTDMWDKWKSDNKLDFNIEAHAKTNLADDVFKASVEEIDKNNISAHQTANALDYGLNSNPGTHIKQIVDFIIDNKFADIELIDETKTKPKHWHITVYSITPAGEEFLNTPNDSLKKDLKEFKMKNKKVFNLIRNIIKQETKKLYEFKKADLLGYDNWEDPSVTYKDCNVIGLSIKGKKFASLVDKVAEGLQLPEPIITSGVRTSEQQVKAMLRLWTENGPEYIKDLYSNKCKSCGLKAGPIVKYLVDNLWEPNKNLLPWGMPVPEEIFNESVRYLDLNGPISSHFDGDALDYGTVSNKKSNIMSILKFIKINGYANFELIDETYSIPPHLHITVKEITPVGDDFLNNVLLYDKSTKTKYPILKSKIY